MTDICFVLMPYAAVERPSAAFGLLKAACNEVGVEVSVIHANLLFAEEIGLARYQFLVHQPARQLTGDWTFSPAAFPGCDLGEEDYLRLVAGSDERSRRVLLQARRMTSAFVDRVARRVLAERPRVVGSSATFQQHVSSLAVLRRVRELAPEVVTVLGGASCDGSMGAANHEMFPWLDYVCSGDGDAIIRELAPLLLQHGRSIPAAKLPPGVIGPKRALLHSTSSSSGGQRATLTNMESQPIPDYSDYFAALKASPLGQYVTPALPVESSRGCWWGQLHHCTFCGIGPDMEYRSKSAERMLRELAALSETYGTRRFLVLDDILDAQYYRTVLPRLAEQGAPYTLNYEIKANVRRHEVELLARAGVLWAQPGIESLHDGALGLMKKGTSCLTNLQLLKWAREYGLRIGWNFLFGIPGEQTDWYSEVRAWLPQVHHLPAPLGMSRVAYYRFSPYFDRSSSYGLTLSPVAEGQHVYPLEQEKLARLSYYFADAAPDPTGSPEHRALEEHVEEWRRLEDSASPPVLSAEDRGGEELRIVDTRRCRTAPEHVLRGAARLVQRACDAALTADGVARHIAGTEGVELRSEEIDTALRQLVERKLVLQHNERYLGLAARGPVPAVPSLRDCPGGYVDVDAYMDDNAYRHLLQIA